MTKDEALTLEALKYAASKGYGSILREMNRKRGSIALARSLCYEINGAADDSDDMDGGGYGSVDIAEILSAEVVRLQATLAQTMQNHSEDNLNMVAQPAQEPWRDSASDYERGFIDGMQKQAQSSVDKAVNRMAQRTWVGLTDEQIQSVAKQARSKDHAVTLANKLLEEKNK